MRLTGYTYPDYTHPASINITTRGITLKVFDAIEGKERRFFIKATEGPRLEHREDTSGKGYKLLTWTGKYTSMVVGSDFIRFRIQTWGGEDTHIWTKFPHRKYPERYESISVETAIIRLDTASRERLSRLLGDVERQQQMSVLVHYRICPAGQQHCGVPEHSGWRDSVPVSEFAAPEKMADDAKQAVAEIFDVDAAQVQITAIHSNRGRIWPDRDRPKHGV
jgi:hypothetical protein